MRALRAKVAEQRFDEPAADALLTGGRIDSEKLDPAGRLLEAELPAAHLTEHEANDAAIDLRDLRGIRIAAEVIRGALLPDLGPVFPGDALVDAADAFNVELGHRAHAHVGHRREV